MDIDDSIKNYEQQKAEIEKYYEQRRLDKLQRRFSELTKALQFQDYIAMMVSYRFQT